MNSRPYHPTQDYGLILGWSLVHSKGLMHDHYYEQSHGIIISEGRVPLMAGFLIQAHPLIGILDGYISNPNSSKLQRKAAMDVLTQELLDKILPTTRHLIATTTYPSVAEMAKKHGAKLLGVENMTLVWELK